ncbi:MAG: accessory Sec system protein Asp3 [Lachnospiraceae bacterium]|nr:accessory Sec system protein Asp3 [Lachnospiraceae bacterium]
MSIEEGKWIVYWRDYSFNSYLYGSNIIFHSEDDVEFNNPLVPPGTVINTWKSQANYQLERVEPTLPIIDGERSYKVRLDVTADKKDSLLVRFRFFQKNGTSEGIYILRGDEGVFKCPIRTYYYEVDLIEAGAHHFHFHSITLEELGDNEK